MESNKDPFARVGPDLNRDLKQIVACAAGAVLLIGVAGGICIDVLLHRHRAVR